MKLKLFTLLVLAAMIISSCARNENDNRITDQFEKKSVYVKINMPHTRADVDSADGTTAVLYNAIIYFLDGDATDPTIFDIKTVGVSGADVTVAEIEAGYKFEGIPEQVTQVYVVGNYNSSDMQNNYPDFPMDDGQTLSDILATIINIEQNNHGTLADSQTPGGLITIMDAQATLQEYNAANAGNWNGDPSADIQTGDMFADVLLIPIVARIEIGELSYTGTLMALTLEGIFINYYYQNLPITLDTDGYTYINNGSDEENYDYNDADFAYTGYNSMYDIIDESVAPNGTATFEPANEVWAYQVFGNAAPVPHIIVKFSSATSSTGAPLGTQYLTITGFLNGATPVNVLARNTIYRIASLEFDDDDLKLLPEQELEDIWVHVDVEPWTTIDVTPVML